MNKQILKGHIEEAFNTWQEERDQMFAVVSAMLALLEERDGRESPEYNAWRLSQIAWNVLGNPETLVVHQVLVMGALDD